MQKTHNDDTNIYLTGDTHGEIDFEKLEIYFSNLNVNRKDNLIILGDAGIVWDKNTLKWMINKYESLGLTIYYIDGNHENFDLLNKFPIVEINNAKVHKVSEHIFHILRGEILLLNKIMFLCIGGAESVDKVWRKEGIDWWSGESINEKDIENALEKVNNSKNMIDYVLTHAAPSIIHVDKLNFKKSESIDKLDIIEQKVKSKYWYFGHYHIDQKFGNKYRCFYQDIIKISE